MLLFPCGITIGDIHLQIILPLLVLNRAPSYITNDDSLDQGLNSKQCDSRVFASNYPTL